MAKLGGKNLSDINFLNKPKSVLKFTFSKNCFHYISLMIEHLAHSR